MELSSMNITLIYPLRVTINLMALWYDLGLGHRRSPVQILPPAVIFFFYTRNKHSLVGHLSIHIPEWDILSQHSILEHVFEHSIVEHLLINIP